MIVGFFLCHQCRHSGTWDILVRFLVERKKNKSFSAKDLDILTKETTVDKKVDALWKQLQKTTQLLTSLPDDAVRNILRNFKLPVRFAGSFVTVRRCEHSALACIYVRVNLNGVISVLLV